MNHTMLERQLQGPPPTLNEQIEEMSKLRARLDSFSHGKKTAANADAFGMHTIAQFVELGVLEVARDFIWLTPIGQHEVSRLGHRLTDLRSQLDEQLREEARVAQAVAEREAELNQVHPDFAVASDKPVFPDVAPEVPTQGQDEAAPADAYGEVVEYGDES